MVVNDRVKEVRHALGLTQIKFAERIAISQSYLVSIELGNKKINERTIRLISMEFSVNEHWLRTGEGSMFNDEFDKKLARINSLFKALNPRFQDCALDHLNVLAELYNSCKDKLLL